MFEAIHQQPLADNLRIAQLAEVVIKFCQGRLCRSLWMIRRIILDQSFSSSISALSSDYLYLTPPCILPQVICSQAQASNKRGICKSQEWKATTYWSVSPKTKDLQVPSFITDTFASPPHWDWWVWTTQTCGMRISYSIYMYIGRSLSCQAGDASINPCNAMVVYLCQPVYTHIANDILHRSCIAI